MINFLRLRSSAAKLMRFYLMLSLISLFFSFILFLVIISKFPVVARPCWNLFKWIFLLLAIMAVITAIFMYLYEKYEFN